MDDMRPRSGAGGPPPQSHRRPLTPEDRQLPEGRLRQELERKKKCCANCVYATRPCGRWFRLVLSEFAGLLICANSAEAPGELRGVPGCSTCPNFRRRPEPCVRVEVPEPVGPLVCTIGLTQRKVALVDAADYPWLSRYRWYAVRDGVTFYARRQVNGRPVAMHRAIMQPPPGMIVDHINGNGLDNRRENLRVCTPERNACNRRRNPHTATGYKGVWRDRRTGRYYAQVKSKGEPIYLGGFDTAPEAARAYDRKAVEVHGEFANLNFPEEWPPKRRAAVMAEAREHDLPPGVPDAPAAKENDSDTDLPG